MLRKYNKFQFNDMFRAAFASWLLMNLLLVVVPRYGAYMMTLTGALLLGASLAYHCLLPTNPMHVRFENNKQLEFRLGWCFYLVIIAGKLLSIVNTIGLQQTSFLAV